MEAHFKKRLTAVSMLVLLAVAAVLALLLFYTAERCGWFSKPAPGTETIDPPPPLEILTEYARRFEPRVERVTGGVYVATGYALGNSVLIVTAEGNVIIDTTESMDAAREIGAAFKGIANRPVLAIIYTHGHPDHILGTAAFLDGQEGPVEIYAHARTIDFLNEQFGQLQPILNLRGMRQFGSYLPEGFLPCCGLGPRLRFDHDNLPPFVFPTAVFEDALALTIGGKELVLFHAPGETDDQIMVWLPEEKVLICGDNYYAAFPNLYTIRGTPPRPIRSWISSLDLARDLRPEYLVPMHTGPVYGQERIYDLLTAYRDAIQYVHDAVIRGANRGKTPDELAAEIRLPPHLAAYPELRELYGEISLSVRAIYQGYLGWFDGNAATLHPLPPAARAQRIAALAGGAEALLAAAKQALEEGEHQWAAELADLLLALEPGSAEVLGIKSRALFKLGEAAVNPNARAYYFTQALELDGKLAPAGRIRVDAATAHLIPVEKIFANMAVRLDPEVSADQVITAVFQMAGSGETYMVAVRRGIAEIRRGGPAAPADLVISVEDTIWKELALGLRNPLVELAAGRLKVEGNKILLLRRFFSLFESD